MRKSKFTEEQIIRFLKQAEAGMAVAEICRKGGFSDATFYQWRAKFGGMDMPEARRLRELEAENAKLKQPSGLGASGHVCPQERARGKKIAPQAKRAPIRQ
jgi:putative transposase